MLGSGPGPGPGYRSGMIGGRQAGGSTFGCKHANKKILLYIQGDAKLKFVFLFSFCVVYTALKFLTIKSKASGIMIRSGRNNQ